MQVPKQPILPRFSFRKIATDLLEIVNLEKGIPYTIKRLITDPGGAMQEYLFVDRSRMVKPFSLLVLLVAIAAYLSFRFLPITEDALELVRKSPELANIPPLLLRTLEIYLNAVKQYFNLTYTSMLPFQAGATYLLYRSFRLNYMEHLVMNVYLFCIQTLVYILTAPFMVQYPALAILQVILTYGYFVFALKHIFQTGWGEAIIKMIAIQVILQVAQIFLLLVVLIRVLIWG